MGGVNYRKWFSYLLRVCGNDNERRVAITLPGLREEVTLCECVDGGNS